MSKAIDSSDSGSVVVIVSRSLELDSDSESLVESELVDLGTVNGAVALKHLGASVELPTSTR